MILEHAQVVKSLEATPDTLEDYGFSESDGERYGWIVERAEFDNDIRAFQLMRYFGVHEGASMKELKQARDIYDWVLDHTQEDITPALQEVELKIGKHVGTERISRVWTYLALQRQEQAIQGQIKAMEL